MDKVEKFKELLNLYKANVAIYPVTCNYKYIVEINRLEKELIEMYEEALNEQETKSL